MCACKDSNSSQIDCEEFLADLMQAGLDFLGLVRGDVRVAALVMVHETRRNAYPDSEFGCARKTKDLKKRTGVFVKFYPFVKTAND